MTFYPGDKVEVTHPKCSRFGKIGEVVRIITGRDGAQWVEVQYEDRRLYMFHVSRVTLRKAAP